MIPAEAAQAKTKQGKAKQEREEGDAEDVSATEDLMREHGVLRRALIVYAESASLLRSKPESIDPSALVDAARMFRSF